MRLIDAIKVQAGCERDDELKSLSPEKKKRLAKLIEERVPSGLAPIDEWNEAISVFSDEKAETDCKKAKLKLLTVLSGEEYTEEKVSESESVLWEF